MNEHMMVGPVKGEESQQHPTIWCYKQIVDWSDLHSTIAGVRTSSVVLEVIDGVFQKEGSEWKRHKTK